MIRRGKNDTPHSRFHLLIDSAEEIELMAFNVTSSVASASRYEERMIDGLRCAMAVRNPAMEILKWYEKSGESSKRAEPLL